MALPYNSNKTDAMLMARVIQMSSIFSSQFSLLLNDLKVTKLMKNPMHISETWVENISPGSQFIHSDSRTKEFASKVSHSWKRYCRKPEANCTILTEGCRGNDCLVDVLYIGN